jgi:tripartite-type tricarboxylate transporter receptor subunit TctC
MRKVVFALAAFCVVASLQGVSAEEAYPRRAIKLIVPFAAGGNTDVVGRLTASYMQKALNANVVVENRAGAGGINGTDAVAKATATRCASAGSGRSRSRRRPRSCLMTRLRTSLRSA